MRCVLLCADTELVHHTLAAALPTDTYFRLNPQDDAFACELDETDYDKLAAMQVNNRLFTILVLCVRAHKSVRSNRKQH